MDTVISQDKRICSKADGLFTEGAVSRVWFGGSYQEHWSADYTLLVSYRDRRQVDAAWRGGRWHPSGGDAAWCETLLRDDCPAFTRRYFEAAATAWCAAQDCLRRGLTLEKLYESFPEAGSKDPIAAAELLRLLMDDCGLKLETALPLVRRCCGAGDAAEDELAALEPLQPRGRFRQFRAKRPQPVREYRDQRPQLAIDLRAVVSVEVPVLPLVQPDAAAAVHHQRHLRPHDRPQPLFVVAGLLVGLLGAGVERIGEFLRGVREDVLLVPEVPVDRRAGDARRGGDLAEADAVVAAFAEQLGRDRRDLRPAVVRAPPRGGGRGPRRRSRSRHGDPSVARRAIAERLYTPGISPPAQRLSFLTGELDRA